MGDDSSEADVGERRGVPFKFVQSDGEQTVCPEHGEHESLPLTYAIDREVYATPDGVEFAVCQDCAEILAEHKFDGDTSPYVYDADTTATVLLMLYGSVVTDLDDDLVRHLGSGAVTSDRMVHFTEDVAADRIPEHVSDEGLRFVDEEELDRVLDDALDDTIQKVGLNRGDDSSE